MIKRNIGVLLLTFVLVVGVKAQLTSALRINEVLPNNISNYVDPFGNRGAWIEIYNNSAGSVQMAGCFLTTDKNNPRMYMISKGDLKTKIGPRQRILIWADNYPHHGTFHTNFELKPNEENYIALFDASGKNIIDEITVPIMAADQSYGAPVDGDSQLKVLGHPTPDAANYVENSNPKVDKFEQKDPDGVVMSVTAMAVVFIALILLFFVFKGIGNLSVMLSARRAMKAKGGDMKTAKEEADIPGEVLAAISMAIYQYQEDEHDYEETVLTMNRVTRNYSPWNSKIYGLRETPKLK